MGHARRVAYFDYRVAGHAPLPRLINFGSRLISYREWADKILVYDIIYFLDASSDAMLMPYLGRPPCVSAAARLRLLFNFSYLRGDSRRAISALYFIDIARYLIVRFSFDATYRRQDRIFKC